MRLKSKTICIGTCFIFMVSALAACENHKQKKPLKTVARPTPTAKKPEIKRSKPVLPKYAVLDEDIYDAPVKAQVSIDLLVSKNISKQELTALLEYLYEKNRTRRGFKYHKYPTNIFISAYTSKEHADSGMGQWVGLVAKSYNDQEPKITVKEQFLAELKKEPEKKLGLTETSSTLDETPKAAVKVEQPAVRKVASWKGTGIKNTEPFIITKVPWAIVWANNASPDGGYLGIYVYRTNGELASIAANITETARDISYIYDKGIFYLMINAANTDWEVEVREGR